MDVLRHDDPSEEFKLRSHSGGAEKINEGVFDSVVAKEWEALVAGES